MMDRPTPAPFTPRATCTRCLRPVALCWCPHLVSLPTRTRVVLLQHPREREVAIGTARMASLCLPNSELHVGVDWGDSAALRRALSDPARPAALLYPGDGAVDIVAHPPDGAVTLVVVDGTWSLTRKLVARNPVLAALPRYAFTPPAPSEYRIRREPTESFVSTLEALVHVLGALEGDPERFRAMLAPFRAMIDAQIACEVTQRNHRGRRPRPPRPPRPRALSALHDRAADVVCVIGEASAWPRRPADRAAPWPEELIQWAAHRPATGERFEALIAPEHPLAPGTAAQTGLDEGDLLRGEARADALARWRAFVRDTDVVCSWGVFGTTLLEAAGGFLPATRVDLRRVARAEANGNVGSPGAYLSRLGGSADGLAALACGRAGQRLAHIAALARHLADQTAVSSASAAATPARTAASMLREGCDDLTQSPAENRLST
jgi:DTW domain-containing protein YfiP